MRCMRHKSCRNYDKCQIVSPEDNIRQIADVIIVLDTDTLLTPEQIEIERLRAALAIAERSLDVYNRFTMTMYTEFSVLNGETNAQLRRRLSENLLFISAHQEMSHSAWAAVRAALGTSGGKNA